MKCARIAVARRQIGSGSVPFAYIPSPSSRFLVNSGPLHIRWYGLLLALGVLLGSAIARRELRRRSIDPDLTYAVALWVVPFGLVGARLYHVATDWSTRFAGHWERIPQVWEGGLGIYGALLGGILGGAIAARRYGIALPALLDCIAPGTALAQALGRFGNYFNQELFGGPTGLPWGLKIDAAHRPAHYAQYTTFHPTFLYELIWNLALAGALIWLGRRGRIRAPGLFALYVAGYSGFRIFEELLRVDPAHHILGLRLNFFVASILCATGLAWFARIQRLRLPRMVRRAGPAALGIALLAYVLLGCAGGHGV
jgi:prolipoprotein diacylglyceryl transferase